jgi:hypothetical protein
MRGGRGRLLMPMDWRFPLFPRLVLFPRLARLRCSKRFARARRLVMLACTVGFRMSGAAREFARAALLTRRRRSRKAGLISRGPLPARTAASMAAATATTAAAATLAAFAALGTIARGLMLFSVRLDAGSRLAA